MAMNVQATIEALRAPLTEVTTEVISLRAAANASATAVANLTATCNTAWDGLSARADQIESDIPDVQGQIRRGGGPGDDAHAPSASGISRGRAT